MDKADGLIDEIVDFWFDEAMKPYWFEPSDSFDRLVRETLLPHHETAAAGGFDPWMEDVDGCLALCILLDQVPRNAFRGSPRAFATDPQARTVAAHALRSGFDIDCTAEERMFLYLPFMHHEDVDSQRLCVRLVRERCGIDGAVASADRHLEIIERFGRFPHRNAILGRDSTAAELAFLKEPNSSF
ncbi:DUF924 domain-containing protein [Azospirillum sp. RWY-5-1]|uniref:DUF924 domain-containing protein n=1 Tax=Azospirillum oleiclasticum TaxID=2735135 RepID=A0ABX2TCJ0_9PROT|nr:DUF924 family protein [Azospirillum oleiclasticum]NYZ15703.1 DUF924 domain-containing protein [Azospirillum oleiclasticum]NYZ21973.1 DUF924 domain-containing protein [Azospirillum oleiclasticum]